MCLDVVTVLSCSRGKEILGEKRAFGKMLRIVLFQIKWFEAGILWKFMAVVQEEKTSGDNRRSQRVDGVETLQRDTLCGFWKHNTKGKELMPGTVHLYRQKTIPLLP